MTQLDPYLSLHLFIDLFVCFNFHVGSTKQTKIEMQFVWSWKLQWLKYSRKLINSKVIKISYYQVPQVAANAVVVALCNLNKNKLVLLWWQLVETVQSSANCIHCLYFATAAGTNVKFEMIPSTNTYRNISQWELYREIT